MSIYIAHPQNEAQENAVKAILEALGVPFEAASSMDETTYLLSTEANKKRLLDSIENEDRGSRAVKLDEIWK